MIGSQLLLGERITSLAEAAGLLTVALTTTVYLGRQVLVARRRKTPRESDPRAEPQLQEEMQRKQPELPQQAQMELMQHQMQIQGLRQQLSVKDGIIRELASTSDRTSKETDTLKQQFERMSGVLKEKGYSNYQF